MLRKLSALLASDQVQMTVAVMAMGWGVATIQKVVEKRKRQLAELNNALADGYSQLVEMKRQAAEKATEEELNGGIED